MLMKTPQRYGYITKIYFSYQSYSHEYVSSIDFINKTTIGLKLLAEAIVERDEEVAAYLTAVALGKARGRRVSENILGITEYVIPVHSQRCCPAFKEMPFEPHVPQHL